MRFLKAAVFKTFRPKVDGSFSVTFETNELNPNEVAELASLFNTFGVLYFKQESQLTDSEMKELDSLEMEYNGISKSKRLKNVFYRVWEKEGKPFTFNEFYAKQMDNLIEHFKKKLE